MTRDAQIHLHHCLNTIHLSACTLKPVAVRSIVTFIVHPARRSQFSGKPVSINSAKSELDGHPPAWAQAARIEHRMAAVDAAIRRKEEACVI